MDAVAIERPILLLRFQAVMMSFGEYGVGDRRVTRDFPTTSLLTGLIANALGWYRDAAADHAALQRALVFATRCDRVPSVLHDFQTVDLGQPRMRPGWTSRGEVAERTGQFGEATHVRWADYLSDGAYTLALALRPGVVGAPQIEEIAQALLRPARPVYLGRRCCHPGTGSVLLGRTAARSVVLALLEAPRLTGTARTGQKTGHGDAFRCWWPSEEAQGLPGEPLRVLGDHRDWSSRAHVGATTWMHGVLTVEEVRGHFGISPANGDTGG